MNIIAKVNKLRNEHGTADPFRICKYLGIIVVKSPLKDGTRGLIKKYKRNYIICINSEMSEFDQIRTCAHELGHYILHKKINTLFMRTCTYLKTDKHEMEAESFANALMYELFNNL